MKLELALIFGEHMVLQRNEPIPVWGRSVRDDEITVLLGGCKQITRARGGEWKVIFPPMEAADRTDMTVVSAATGESVSFQDVAIGEVWLAGGQSNMEFLLKYDECAEEMYREEADPQLRYFRYPLACFPGCLEKEPYPDDGFWRSFTARESRGMFSAAAAFMGRGLRKALGIPVGLIGVNWGGTPAAAWTSLKDIQENQALKTILDWYEEGCSALDLTRYYAASELVQKEPSAEMKARMDRLMMGIGLEEFFQNGAPPPPPSADYAPFQVGPRAAVRPGGLYDSMLKKVAPYGVRGAVWYQGEDDDFRGWYEFYDESMKTLIASWRKLWRKDLPFFQVELAPFQGRGATAAKRYDVMRTKQRAVMDSVPGVHNVCIMDSGDPLNIHVRRKKPVGERLSLLARKYVYGETGLLADSPRCIAAEGTGDVVEITWRDCGEGLFVSGGLSDVLRVRVGGREISPRIEVRRNKLLLRSEVFAGAEKIHIEFAEMNYCVDPLYNSAGLPAFPFTIDVVSGGKR